MPLGFNHGSISSAYQFIYGVLRVAFFLTLILYLVFVPISLASLG